MKHTIRLHWHGPICYASCTCGWASDKYGPDTTLDPHEAQEMALLEAGSHMASNGGWTWSSLNS